MSTDTGDEPYVLPGIEETAVSEQMTCRMYCDQPAIFYVSAKTTVPMTERMPLCEQHAVTYGKCAVEVATAGPVMIRRVEITLEPIELADLLARLDGGHAVVTPG